MEGCFREYFLEDLHGKTRLRVELESPREYREMMGNGFKKGFEIVKQLAEA